METRSPRAAEETGGAHSLIFDALYHQHKSLVFDFAWRLTQDRAEAEDLFQETWLRVVKNLPKIDVQNFKAWVFAVTANLYRDALRKKRVRRLFLWQKSTGALDERKKSSLENEMLSSRDESECMDAGRAISQAIAGLPGKQRCVFVLKEIEGFKYSEIGEMLRIPLGTLKTLMHRAVKRLRQELSAYNEKGCPFVGGIKNEMQRN